MFQAQLFAVILIISCSNALEVPSYCKAPGSQSDPIPLTAPSGSLFSPGFESNEDYPENIECSYLIQVDKASYYVSKYISIYQIEVRFLTSGHQLRRHGPR